MARAYQLYFALRLAAIEDYVAIVAPCPVILDDILIHSDNLRASAALQVLAEIAQRTQVLFFTHHSRLADLGLKAGASVIYLQPSAASNSGLIARQKPDSGMAAT